MYDLLSDSTQPTSELRDIQVVLGRHYEELCNVFRHYSALSHPAHSMCVVCCVFLCVLVRWLVTCSMDWGGDAQAVLPLRSPVF